MIHVRKMVSVIPLACQFLHCGLPLVMVVVFLWSMPVKASDGHSADQAMTVIKTALLGKDNTAKFTAVAQIAQLKPVERADALLKAWLGGKLYYEKSTKRLFTVQKYRDGQPAIALDTGEIVVMASKRAYKKVRVNNALRTSIRTQLASLALYSDNANNRLQAVTMLVGKTDAGLITTLRALQQDESNPKVYEQIALALAVADTKSGDADKQIQAIRLLGKSKHTVVPRVLKDVIAHAKGTTVKGEAENALKSYERKQSFYAFVETAFFGLSLGSILVLAGIGLAITFGVMGVINMAHGELIMIGAYTTYVVQLLMSEHIGASLWVAIPVAFIVSAIVGIIIERLVIRHLYGRPLETLLATFGISLILQQAVRSIFSPLNRAVKTPDWMAGAWEINPMLALTYNRLYIIIFCIIVFFVLLAILKRTTLGLQVRAVSQNRAMASAMGVHCGRVDMMTFGLGSGIAGIAGVALSQLTNVGPNMGQAYIIDSFMVVVFGGVGNLWGTLVAGLSLGIFNKVLEPWFGVVLAKILVLLAIILFIQKRPKGLFPQKGRSADD